MTIIEIAEAVGGPFGSAEVAERLGCDRRAAIIAIMHARRRGEIVRLGHDEYTIATEENRNASVAPPHVVRRRRQEKPMQARRPARADAPAPHPLFPAPDTDEEAPRVDEITVRRYERTGPVFSPRRFTPAELGSLADLHRLYGGGTYELWARETTSGAITGRQTYTLPGPSLPLDGGPEHESAAPLVAPAPPPTADPTTTVIVALIQSQAQSQVAMFGLLGKIVETVSTRGADAGSPLMASLAKMAESDRAALVGLLTNLAQGGGGQLAGLQMGIELARKFSAAGAEGGDVTGTINAVVDGMKTLERLQTQRQDGAAAAQPQPAELPPEPQAQ